MRRFIRTSSVALVGLAMLVGPMVPLAVAGSQPSDVPSAMGGGPSHDSWIVTLAPGSGTAGVAGSLARGVGGRVGHVYRYAMNGFQFRGSAQAADALRRKPHVVAVAPDYPVYLTESLPNGIERISAYDNDTPSSSAYHQGYRGNGARIAIMDTGVDLDHPDLVNAIDQGLGKNCVAPALPPNDGYGHGTHVAGTAAAPLNGVGVVGVAPEARLVAVKVFDDAGNSSESLVLCGFDHVLSLNADGDPSNDVDVLNMSFGEQRSWGDCVTDALHTAVCNAYAAGITMVAGAGNSAVNASSFVPAAFDEVIGVSALADFDAAPGGLAGCGFVADLGLECDDTFAFFSNYGASVDVIAPGVSVYSTYAGGGYSTKSGTSMATPHVSGVAALMAALSPTPTPATMLTLLRQTAECPDGTVSGADAACSGQGTWPDDPDGIPEPMVNALRAALGVGSPPTPVPPSAPTLTSATPGDASVSLAWAPPVSDGGSPLTGYEIWRGLSSGAESLLATIGTGPAYTDTSVTNGTTYYYQVAAVNSVGPGPRSNEVSATPEAPPAGATYVPLAPARLLDTRVGNGLSGTFASGVPRTFQVTGRGGVPANAIAVTGNLTVTQQTRAGYVYLGPDPVASPTSSTLNFPLSDNRANGVTVALSATGSLSATYMAAAGGTTHLIFDVTGYFVPDGSGATYVPLAPARLLDTRVGNGLSGTFASGVPRTFQVTGRGGVPAEATAVTGNLTVTEQTRAGYVYLGPDPVASPTSSTLNFPLADNRANGVTVALSLSGSLSATYAAVGGGTTHLVFDVTGYFVP